MRRSCPLAGAGANNVAPMAYATCDAGPSRDGSAGLTITGYPGRGVAGRERTCGHAPTEHPMTDPHQPDAQPDPTSAPPPSQWVTSPPPAEWARAAHDPPRAADTGGPGDTDTGGPGDTGGLRDIGGLRDTANTG